MLTANSVGCIILSVDYRLAPETHAPDSVEDCYAGLRWLWTKAPELGVDRTKIAVMGESAGGGLAAALTLLARDRGEIALAYQLLDAPMIDDRTCIRPRHPVNSDFTWTFENNVFGWTSLLGTEPGGPDVSPYAAAARATDLSGLPPTFISCSSLDLFLDENLDYAGRLARAGVPVELHVYPRAFHGFALNPDAAISKAATQEKRAALRRAFDSVI